MKFGLTIAIIGIAFSAFGQDKFDYEQIAFRFYADSILKANPPKKKLTVWTELQTIKGDPWWFPRCMNDLHLETKDSLVLNASGLTKIEPGNDDRFRIRKLHTGGLPRVYASVSFSTNPNRQIVNIVEVYKSEGVIYHIAINAKGEVTNVCKGGWIE